MTPLLHVLGWFVIIVSCSYSIAVQGVNEFTGMQKFERAALGLSICYLIGVSLVRFP